MQPPCPSGRCCAASTAPVPVPGWLHQSLVSSCLHWETEEVLNNGELRINPYWSPGNSWLSGRAVLAAGWGALEYLDSHCSNSRRSLQAAGVAKSLTQVTYISAVNQCD